MLQRINSYSIDSFEINRLAHSLLKFTSLLKCSNFTILSFSNLKPITFTNYILEKLLSRKTLDRYSYYCTLNNSKVDCRNHSTRLLSDDQSSEKSTFTNSKRSALFTFISKFSESSKIYLCFIHGLNFNIIQILTYIQKTYF